MDASGYKAEMTYDGLGRQSRIFPLEDGAWDGFGRITSTTTNMGGFSRTVARRYDREGRRVELTFTGRQMEAQPWAAQNRIPRQFFSASAIKKHINENYSKVALEISPEHTE